MKKVLSFVLILALVLGSFSFAFGATPAKGFTDTNAESVGVLSGLGVVNGYPDGTFKPEGIVTRAEMAKLIVVGLGLENFATATTSKYPDMAGAAWAQGYVAYATSLGIINGYPDGTFGPSRTVTYNEACAMIVRALGYTAEFLPGGWPAEWVVKAQTLGILKGVSAAGAAGATRVNIAEMLYNALELEIGYVNNDGNWMKNEPTDTMLVRLGAEFVAAKDAENGGIIYGDEDTMINLRSFVGAYADRYVNEDDEIIKVVPVSTFLTGKYNEAKNLFEADNGTDFNIALSIANPTTTPDAIGFVNGVKVSDTASVEAWDNATTDGAFTIAVDWSGKTIKKVYSVSAWFVTSDLLFDDGYADEIADDQKLDSNKFILDSSDEIDLMEFELLGVASLDAIAKDNVVYVYVGDGEIRKIEVGTETVTGKITKTSGGDYTIDGSVYNQAADFIGAALKLGETGTAKLDYAGDIYDWDIEDATADNYAIVISTKWVAASAFDDSQVKLITKDGNKTIYKVEDDATITSFSGISDNELVTFSLNKDGNIDKMNECTWAGLSATGQLNAGRTIYDGKILDSAVIVFTTGADGYDVAKISDVDTETALNANSYSKTSKVNVLLVNEVNAGSGDTVYAVINDVSSALNADDDEVLYVEGFADGKAFAAYTAKNVVIASANTTPTIYELTQDADGVITKATAYPGITTGLKFIPSGLVDDKDGNYLVKMGGTWYSVDASASVYELVDADMEYSLKSISAVKTGTTVTIWQTDKDSEVYDLIIIEK